MNILNEILEVKKEEVKNLRKKYTISSLSDSEFFEKPALSFIDRAKNSDKISIIAEIKKASPSKGIIKENFDHLKIAGIYFENEVDAVSVLTDKNFFKGDLRFLSEISRIKNAPVLRKDFLIDEFQILESKANGADMILLICEALSSSQIDELTHAAYESGLEVLLELHSEDELKKINFNLNKLIGINNRNLNDFSVDLNTTKVLSKKIPQNIFLVSESGISNEDDIRFLKNETNANGILVGEHLMRSKDISSEIKRLKEWCGNES